jgi:hypothetical protein
MKRVIGIALLVGGIVLLIYGFKARDSIESKLSETFRGSPSRNSLVLLSGGAICSVAGLALVFFGNKP